MHYVFAYGIDTLALLVSLLAYVVARAKGPTAWARRVQDVELGLADQAERHDALQLQVAKWRSRQASRERRAEGDQVEQDDGEPDAQRNPAAWKAWVNNGGIRYLKGRTR